jgi:hypothetical protein
MPPLELGVLVPGDVLDVPVPDAPPAGGSHAARQGGPSFEFLIALNHRADSVFLPKVEIRF